MDDYMHPFHLNDSLGFTVQESPSATMLDLLRHVKQEASCTKIGAEGSNNFNSAAAQN